MNVDQLREVIRDVFGRNFKTEVGANGWLKFRCPLAPYTHASGADSNPSAGLSISDNSVSVFNCFTCGNKAPLPGLLRKYANYTGEDLDDLIEELEEEAYLGVRELPSWESKKSVDADAPLPELDKAIFLDLYEPAAGHPYLRSRGISDETAGVLQLMVDPEDPVDGEERILFPVFGVDGALHGFTGRAVSKTARLKVRDYHGLPKGRCVLGAHLIAQRKPKYMLVVEGLFDYANAWQCGEPAVAVMHSTLTDAQAGILRGFSIPTYLFYDDDDAGQKGVTAAGEALSGYQPVMKVRYPRVWIEDQAGGGHWLKDPGELVREEFEDMRHDARLY